MKSSNQRMAALLLASLASCCSLLQSVQAGTPIFTSTNRDLVLCFRKTGADGGTSSTKNLEINIGQASQYYNATPGSPMAIAQLSRDQINGLFDSLDDLSWSVGGFVPFNGDNGDASVPDATLWVTAPRSDPLVPALPWVRNSATTQGITAGKMSSILSQAAFYSGTIAASTNNTASVVVVPNNGHDYGTFMGPFGNYANTFAGGSQPVENTTPATFDSDGLPSRSDLYELRPDATGTQPAGKYLGFFQLNPSGSMLFFAASPAPPAPTLSITRSGTQSTISFATSMSATYTLYYTNVTGIQTPIHTWATNSTTLTGDGTMQSFQDTTTDATRVYSVGVH